MAGKNLEAAFVAEKRGFPDRQVGCQDVNLVLRPRTRHEPL
jgi:hypothetical protein